MADVDIKITENGDLFFSNNDLVVITDDELRAQIAANRIKSIANDWYYDHIGADMESIIGLPCNEDTAKTGLNKIYNSLVFDGYFKEEEIYIVYEVSTSNKNINFNVYIKSINNNPTTLIKVAFDLVKGINLYY